MRIAIDAMGGDYAPSEVVKGAVRAAGELSAIEKLFLVGDREAVCRELDRLEGVSRKIELRHTTEVVAMDEAPAQAVRRKKDSSIGRAVDMVRQGEVDAMLSAGNTGAVVVAASLKLRTLKGVERPGIATVMPTQKRPLVLIDAGATTDCGPSMLRQFAVMGSVYSREILGQANPVVGLLSIGGEAAKGNEITREAFRLLEISGLNFRGNVEGHDVFRGEIDVVVCDGFVGNIVLKTSESVAHAIGLWLKQEFSHSLVRKAGGLLARKAFRALKQKLDPESYGGALLLGVNGVCIITHGSSSERAIFHAARVATESVGQRINHLIVDEIAAIDPRERE